MVLATVWGGWRAILYLRVQSELSRIRAEGYPATAVELEAWYAYPKGPNAADIYLKAFDALVKDEELEKKLPGIGVYVQWPTSGESVPADMVAAIHRYLELNKQSLQLLHEAATIPECRYPLDFTQGADGKLTHVGGYRRATRLLDLEASWAIRRGDAEQFVASLQTLGALARSIRNEPLPLSYEISVGARLSAVETLEPGFPSWTLANEHRWPPAHSLPSAPPPPQQRLLFIF